ncbi:MAG: hypothetical protein J6N32_13195 [Clostridia bacterium]|nr:hypothetical protein [Clostridia bacterium]MBP3294702.1 hypothetical protein [Clostridia bacterium]MBQ7313212.1 hypothetical protein [Clostridia bacterium]
MAAENERPVEPEAKGIPDLAGTVESIMSSPEFAGIINELRGGGDSGNTQAPPLAQEDILSRLPEVMAMLKPLVGTGASAESSAPPPKTDPEPETKPPEVKAVSAILPKKYDKSRAEKLMAALKPYLSSNRCEIIDKCVSVMQITDVMEALQGIEGIPGLKPKP